MTAEIAAGPARPDLAHPPTPQARRFIVTWLGIVAFLVLCMIALGGATRLTDSGLSMTDWRPTGTLPPLSEAAWEAELEKYRQFPEYQQINRGMSLPEFKRIYWYEYAHRMLGRAIGLSFALPLAFVLWRRWAPGALGRRLVALLFLGGTQGLIGWWMVQSGLVDRPDVSHYRLAVHLTVAFVIYAALVWTMLGLARGHGVARGVSLPRLGGPGSRWAWAFVVLVLVQVVSGAFVAGLKAGHTYNTWPLMDGRFIPQHLWLYTPTWLAPFEHVTFVQFNHRIIAYLLVGFAAVLALRAQGYLGGQRLPDAMRASAQWVFLAVLAQAMLGVATLLSVVPVHLGVLHQIGAVGVLTVALVHARRTTPRHATA